MDDIQSEVLTGSLCK